MSNITQFFSATGANFNSACALGTAVDITPVTKPILICKAGGTAHIIAPKSAEIGSSWYDRKDALKISEDVTGMKGWFIPTSAQLQNPGYSCRSFWDSFSGTLYWSSTETNATAACTVNFTNGSADFSGKQNTRCVRAFRQVTY